MQVLSANINDLLPGLQSGDEQAFSKVFLALYPRLCQFAEKFVRDTCDAEDIVEDVFLKLWNRAVVFKDEEHLKASLYRSIQNACLNFLKINKRAFDRNSVFTKEQGEYEEATYLSEITRNEIIAELYAAISELPSQARKVIIKTYIEGQSNQEVADELGISINTVKNHKQNGLVLLRSKLPDATYLFLFVITSTYWID